jgi:hypothetical protein
VLRAQWRTPTRALILLADFSGQPAQLAADTIVWESRSADPAHPWTILAGIGVA